MTYLDELYKIKIDFENSVNKRGVYKSLIKKISGNIFSKKSVLFLPTRFLDTTFSKESFLYQVPNYLYSTISDNNDIKRDFSHFILYYSIFEKINYDKSITETLLLSNSKSSFTRIYIDKKTLRIKYDDSLDELSIDFESLLTDEINEKYKYLFNKIYLFLEKKLSIIKLNNKCINNVLYDEKELSYIDIINFVNNNKDLLYQINSIADEINRIEFSTGLFQENTKFNNVLLNLYLLGKYSSFKHFHYISSLVRTSNSNTLGIGFGSFIFMSSDAFDNSEQLNAEQLTHLIWSYFSVIELKSQSTHALNHATKSAIAAIMSRNMSHNLGSHILFYLKSILNHTPKRLENLLYEIEKANDDSDILKILNKYKDKIVYTGEEEINVPFLRGLGKFIGYLQERQDFIATIASDFIPYLDNVNFKDFIYDEILPDKKQKRHDSYEIKNIFLDFIAKSEGYDSNSIDILINDFDGNNTNDEILKKLRKLKVDLPGGILGRQAFFSIFENILRNSAKHNDVAKKLQLNIKIEKDENFPDFYKISIYDNLTNYDKVHKAIEGALKQNYIDSNGKMLKTNKGIKEMRISAAWLRGLSVAEIIEDDIGLIDEPNKILHIEEEGDRLAYVFYLYKSKTVAFITENCEDVISQTIDCFTFEQYKKVKNKNYKILLINEALDENTKEEIKKISVPRILEVSNKEVVDKINEGAEDKNQNTTEFFHIKFIKNSFKDIIDFNNDKFITIVEKTADNNISEHIKLLDGDTHLPKNPINSTILFKVHNDTKEKFMEFKENFPGFYKKCLFLEGISGNNSTARLLRNEKKTDYWAFKMAESALTKIIVFDERLFDIYGGIIPGVNFSFESFQDCNTKDEFIEKLKENKGKISSTLENHIDDYFNLSNNPVEKRHKLEKIIYSLNNINTQKSTNNYRFDLLRKKNIELFNIIATEDSLYIFNLKGDKVYDSFKDDLKELNNNQCNPANKIDFLLIHQSLLDKMYNFYIKENNIVINEKKDKDIIKENIFHFIKNYFNIKQRVIIHSGRSEPEFLPEDAVFNQFSSIDNAFSDCKHTLSELLYSSRINKS